MDHRFGLTNNDVLILPFVAPFVALQLDIIWLVRAYIRDVISIQLRICIDEFFEVECAKLKRVDETQ